MYYFLKNEIPTIYDKHIKWIQSKKCENKPNKFKLYSGGILEEVLSNKSNLRLRAQLVYKNFYYGSYKKHKIKISVIMTSSSPAHFNFPELLPWLEPRVKMPVDVLDHLKAKIPKS